MALKTCNECKKEVSSKAEACPHCGAKLKKKRGCLRSFGMAFLAVVVLLVLGVIFSNSSKDTQRQTARQAIEKESEALEVTSYKVGETFKSSKFEITVTSVKKKESVGSEYFNSRPAEGGVYVAVQWKFKNITSEPIGSFSTPSLFMLDPNGVKYDADISASSNYATELKLDRKIASKLNPGITVKDAEVFEISKESLNHQGWKLQIRADKNMIVDSGF